jgi:hypothetical protein
VRNACSWNKESGYKSRLYSYLVVALLFTLAVLRSINFRRSSAREAGTSTSDLHQKEIENPFGKALIIENRRWTYGLSDAALKISQIRTPIPITLDQSIRTREHMRLTMPSNSIPLAVFGHTHRMHVV